MKVYFSILILLFLLLINFAWASNPACVPCSASYYITYHTTNILQTEDCLCVNMDCVTSAIAECQHICCDNSGGNWSVRGNLGQGMCFGTVGVDTFSDDSPYVTCVDRDCAGIGITVIDPVTYGYIPGYIPPECIIGNATASTPPIDLCADKHCKERYCEDNVSYYDGRCDPNTGNCVYSSIRCPKECLDENECAEVVQAVIDFTTPTDKMDIPSNGQPVPLEISGLVENGDAAGLSKVLISIPGVLLPTEAELTGESFKLNVTLGPRSYYDITAEAYDASGNLLGSRSINILTYVIALYVQPVFGDSRLFINGKEYDSPFGVPSMKPGDYLEVTEDGGAEMAYSDGTKLTLNKGTTLIYKVDGIYLTKGGVTVDVTIRYEVDTKFGHVKNTGTLYSVSVDSEQMNVSVTEGEVNVTTLLNSTALVVAGQQASVGADGIIHLSNMPAAMDNTTNNSQPVLPGQNNSQPAGNISSNNSQSNQSIPPGSNPPAPGACVPSAVLLFMLSLAFFIIK